MFRRCQCSLSDSNSSARFTASDLTGSSSTSRPWNPRPGRRPRRLPRRCSALPRRLIRFPTPDKNLPHVSRVSRGNFLRFLMEHGVDFQKFGNSSVWIREEAFPHSEHTLEQLSHGELTQVVLPGAPGYALSAGDGRQELPGVQWVVRFAAVRPLPVSLLCQPSRQRLPAHDDPLPMMSPCP